MREAHPLKPRAYPRGGFEGFEPPLKNSTLVALVPPYDFWKIEVEKLTQWSPIVKVKNFPNIAFLEEI